MGSDWEAFGRAALRTVVKRETRHAIAALAALRMTEPTQQFDIATIASVAKAVGARLAPVAACFGWLPLCDSRRGWVNVVKHQAGAGVLSADDLESLCLFAVFRGSPERVVATLVGSKGGQSEVLTGNPGTFRARRDAVEADARRRREDKQSAEERLAKLRAMAPQLEAAVRDGTWVEPEGGDAQEDEIP